MPERLVITEKLPVFRILLGSVLALPGEFAVGYKVVDVSMIRAHVLFGEGDQEEDLWILEDEPGVPDSLAESEPEGRRYCFAQITPPIWSP